jgi:hypothetical protein
MREEEKLARDVYLTLYEKWNCNCVSGPGVKLCYRIISRKSLRLLKVRQHRRWDVFIGIINAKGITDSL